MTEQETDVSWALKLLERDADYRPNLLVKYFNQGLFTVMGVSVPIAGNLIYKRPIWAGIHVHAILAVVGFGIGTILNNREITATAKRDAILRDYIIRHPEDFPAPERKTYGEVFLKWTPYR